MSGELNIPESWAENNLEIAGRWGSGGTPLKGKSEYYGGNINWLKTGDLTNGVVSTVSDTITEVGFKAIPSKLYPVNTIIMAMYGATIGKLGILQVEAAVNQACACCETYEQIQNIYLFYWLMNHKKEFIHLGQGGAQPNISRKIIYEQPFGIPPQKEQVRIVEKIESCFSKIEKTETALKEAEVLLSKYRESLLAKAFRGELIPQNSKDEPASELLKRIKAEQAKNDNGKKKKKELPPISEDEIPFDIPESWEWVRFGALINFIESGWSPKCNPHKRKSENDWAVLKVSAVTWGEYKHWEHKELPIALDPRPQHEVKKDDFLLSRANTIKYVGKSVFVYDSPPKLMMSDKLLRIDLPMSISKEFINLYNNSNFTRDHYERHAAGTSSSMLNVSRGQISELPIPVPPPNEQIKIINQINRYFDKLQSIEDKIHKQQVILVKQKESILNNSFQGKLVPQIPKEGTGHELLAEILKAKELEKSKKKVAKKKVAKKKTIKGKK